MNRNSGSSMIRAMHPNLLLGCIMHRDSTTQQQSLHSQPWSDACRTAYNVQAAQPSHINDILHGNLKVPPAPHNTQDSSHDHCLFKVLQCCATGCTAKEGWQKSTTQTKHASRVDDETVADSTSVISQIMHTARCTCVRQIIRPHPIMTRPGTYRCRWQEIDPHG